MGTFWFYLFLLEAWVILQGCYTWQEGLLKQYVRHGGIWGDFLYLGPVLAYIWSYRASAWSIPWFAGMFALAGVLGTTLIKQWLHDSKTCKDSMAVNGYLNIPGAMHYVYLVVGLASIGMYFVFSQDSSISERVTIALLLSAHMGFGILLPPFTSTGHIPRDAWLVAVCGWVAISALNSLSFIF